MISKTVIRWTPVTLLNCYVTLHLDEWGKWQIGRSLRYVNIDKYCSSLRYVNIDKYCSSLRYVNIDKYCSSLRYVNIDKYCSSLRYVNIDKYCSSLFGFLVSWVTKFSINQLKFVVMSMTFVYRLNTQINKQKLSHWKCFGNFIYASENKWVHSFG